MKKYELRYDNEQANHPVLAKAILETGCLVNILAADIKARRGHMIISIVGDLACEKRMVSYLKKWGVDIKALDANIKKDDAKCVDCGACAGICPTLAITMQDETMELDKEKCIRCGECILVCPTRALTLPDQ